MDCLKIALVAWMTIAFSACSVEAPGSVSGGSSEESDVYALAGQAGNLSPRLLKLKDQIEVENQFSVKKGSIVKLIELDSVSFTITERYFVDTVFNDEGNFAFNNLSLSSPYVLVFVLDSCYREDCSENGILYDYTNRIRDKEDSAKYSRMLSAVVDLREFKTKSISVNVLTDLKVPILLELVASGIPFATANTQAEKQVLESYGVYEDLSCFECLDDANSELAFVRQLVQEYYTLNPKALHNMNELKLTIEAYWNTAPDIFAFDGKKMETLYRNSKKMLEYKLGYWAHRLGYGPCTDQNEGETFILGISGDDESSALCRSGKWLPGHKKMDFVRDSIVDRRDGKSYKTVTYKIGGITQTWMADDLNYTGTLSATGDSLKTDLREHSSCYYEKDSLCEVSSREYRWDAAMNLDEKSIRYLSVKPLASDTTYLPEICVNAHMIMEEHPVFCAGPGDDCVANLWNHDYGGGYCIDIVDSNGGIDNWTWNYTELMPEFKSDSYQGICPEGWRIPNKRDWKTLVHFVMEEYGIDSSRVGTILADDYASGFGMKNNLYVTDIDKNWIFVNSLHSYIAVPDFQIDRNAGASGVQINDRDYYTYRSAENYNYVFYRYVVRCIKR